MGPRVDDVVIWAQGVEDLVIWAQGVDDIVIWAQGVDDIIWVQGVDDAIIWAQGVDDVVILTQRVDDVVPGLVPRSSIRTRGLLTPMCFHDLVLDDFMVVLLVIDYLVCPYSPGSMRDFSTCYYISTFCFCWLDCFVSNDIPLFCIYLSFSV